MVFSSWLRNWKRSIERRWSLYQALRRKPRTRRQVTRLRLELLEDRWLLSTIFIVSNTNNSGAGSLEQAILNANANTAAGGSAIDFNIGAVGTSQTISLTSALTPLTKSVYINGLSQGGTGNTTPLIELNGTSAGYSDGLLLQASGCTISGLLIENFSLNGIEVGANSNTIGGTTAGAGNVLSGNSNDGILIDSGVSGVQVQGNSIGTNAAGTSALANGLTVQRGFR